MDSPIYDVIIVGAGNFRKKLIPFNFTFPYKIF